MVIDRPSRQRWAAINWPGETIEVEFFVGGMGVVVRGGPDPDGASGRGILKIVRWEWTAFAGGEGFRQRPARKAPAGGPGALAGG